MSGAYESNDHFQLGWCAHASVRTTGARSDTDLACYLMYFRWHMNRNYKIIFIVYLRSCTLDNVYTIIRGWLCHKLMYAAVNKITF